MCDLQMAKGFVAVKYKTLYSACDFIQMRLGKHPVQYDSCSQEYYLVTVYLSRLLEIYQSRYEMSLY